MTRLPNGRDDAVELDPVEVYLREVASVSPLTAEAELNLAKEMARSGASGETAMKDLVEAHLRLVVDIAMEYAERGVHVLDLMVAGNNGLMKSARRFDDKRGRRFAACARPWIRRAIMARLRAARRTSGPCSCASVK